MTICFKCSQEIHFNDSMVSETGKKIPLQGDDQEEMVPHNCPANTYKKKSSTPKPQTLQSYAKVDYGTPSKEFVEKHLGLKWIEYAATAQILVDKFQPDLDERTRGAAISATIDQHIAIRND